MLTGATEALLAWAVYRSLDDQTGAPLPEDGMPASRRLAEWRQAGLTDEELLTAISRVYRHNLSRRQPGEPRVVLSGWEVVKIYKKLDQGVLDRLVGTCGDGLVDCRDRMALLMAWDLAWSQGSRKVKDIADMTVQDTALSRLGERAARAVQTWVTRAGLTDGFLLRDISRRRDGAIGAGLAADAFKAIENERAVLAGLGRWNPALWADWEDEAPDLAREKSPDLQGRVLVGVVRGLMALDRPPPLPER